MDASSSATPKAAPRSVAPLATVAPAAKSTAPIPRIAIAAGAVVVLLVVVVVAGFIYATHRAKQKVAELESADNTQKSIADLAAAADKMSQKAKRQAAIPTNAPAAAASAPAAPYGYTLDANGKLVPASAPKTEAEAHPMPKADPVVPVAATGTQAHDWALKYERTEGGAEADLVVRTGDINNLGFGWPTGFDPFSGQSTPPHQWPDINNIPAGAPDGTDRIMLGTSVMPVHMVTEHVTGQADRIVIDSVVKQIGGDGYSGALGECYGIRNALPNNIPDPIPASLRDQKPAYLVVPPSSAAGCTRDRELTTPTPIVLAVGTLPSKIDAVLFQLFTDDFQPVPMHSHFQVSLNGTRIPSFEYAINALDQSGPIGKLVSLKLLPEYFPLLKSGTVKLLIDDPTTHVPDGYAVDFVRILVNPHNFKYQVSLTASVVDADKHTPITGATVTAALESAATDRLGKCKLAGMPAGLVTATANAPGYDENSVPVDLVAGQSGNAEIQLHRHQESTAALEQSIARTGTATIYGIHFDTGSAKLRPDSTPALNAVLGLINNHPGSRWFIAGHTDNQGNAALNQPLSESRAKSVVTWLKAHGVEVNRLVPQGFGATRPVADNSTANGRALNRRVEVALAAKQ